MPKPISITALEKALAKKQQQAAELMAQKKMLLRQVAKIDKKIQALTGGAGLGGRSAVGTRRKNAKPLMECVVEALGKSKAPMTASELADAVTAMGYVSASKDLRQQIWTQIYKDERVGKAGRGKFVLAAKEGKAKAKTAGKKKTKK